MQIRIDMAKVRVVFSGMAINIAAWFTRSAQSIGCYAQRAGDSIRTRLARAKAARAARRAARPPRIPRAPRVPRPPKTPRTRTPRPAMKISHAIVVGAIILAIVVVLAAVAIGWPSRQDQKIEVTVNPVQPAITIINQIPASANTTTPVTTTTSPVPTSTAVPETTTTPIPTTTPVSQAALGFSNLRALIYENSFNDYKGTFNETSIDHTWGEASPLPEKFPNLTRFSVKWLGKVVIPEKGRYRFTITADDMIYLQVAGKELVEQWVEGGKAVTTYTADIDLNAGSYDIRVKYMNDTAKDSKVKLSVEKIG